MEKKLLTNWQVVSIGVAAAIPVLFLTLNPSILCLPFGIGVSIGGAFAGKYLVNKVWGVWIGAILGSILGVFARISLMALAGM